MKKELHKDELDQPVIEDNIEKEIEPIGKKKNPLIFIIPGVIALLILGFVFVKVFGNKGETKKVTPEDAPVEEVLREIDSSVSVDLVKSKVKDNSVVITVTGLASRFVSIGYELQYESGGVGKGVTSGSKPLDVTGQDTFEREIYLGTCSKNVCKPDLGITKVGLVLEFTNTAGTKYQFSKEFEL
jgi:hypothetical protein